MKTMMRIARIVALALGVLLLVPLAGLPTAGLYAPRAVRPGRVGLKAARRRDAEGQVGLGRRRAWFDTPMTRAQFANLTNLELMLRTIFYDQLTAVADPNAELARFFNEQTSADAVERSQGVGGFGDVPEYTGAIEYDDFEVLFRKEYEHVEYAKGMAVERKLIDDEKYGVIRQRTERFGLAFDRTIYKHRASVFNNAFSAAHVGGDAKALCATDHPLSPTDASTQSNKGTSALTQDAVIATETAMMQYTDSEGNPIVVAPDTLVVPVALKTTAEVIVNSEAKPGTANNDANVTDGYRVVVSRYLTDANNWFMVDSRLARMYLNWYWRVRPEYRLDPTSDFNLVSRFRGYMRYSFGWDHWAWLYGHEVS